jgi:sulfopyruvate decarboxylase TPP-binding subunit
LTPELARQLVDGLKEAEVDFISFLPESRMGGMVPLLASDGSFIVVRASHEGTAVALACGAALVGRRSAVYTEGTGFVASMYTLESTAMQFGLPLLFLVSYVGSPGDDGNSNTFSLWGRRLESQIQALGLQYRVLEDGHDLKRRIVEMARAAQSAKLPACLLFTGEFTVRSGS